MKLHTWFRDLAPEVQITNKSRSSSSPQYHWLFILLHRPLFHLKPQPVARMGREIDHVKVSSLIYQTYIPTPTPKLASPHPRLLEFPTLLPLPLMTQHLRLKTELWLDLPPTFPSSSWSGSVGSDAEVVVRPYSSPDTRNRPHSLSRFQPFTTIPRIRTKFSTFLSPLKLRYFPIVRLPPRTKGCQLQLCRGLRHFPTTNSLAFAIGRDKGDSTIVFKA